MSASFLDHCQKMLAVLKRAHEVMTQEGGASISYEQLVEECIDIEPYKNKVYIHIYISFYRGGSHEEHWLLTTKEYTHLYKQYYSGKNLFCFGEVNGKHSDVQMPWKRCVDKVVKDAAEIYEIAMAHELDEDGAEDHLNGLVSSDEEDEDNNDDEDEEGSDADKEEKKGDDCESSSGQPEEVDATPGLKRPRKEPEAPPIISPQIIATQDIEV